jgi:hypothetical protein
VVDPAEVELDDESSAWLASDAADATARRNVGLLRDYAQRPAPSRTHRILLRFLRSPVEILGDERGADGTALPGEYAVGWIKRGPSGVIGTNKKDAADTVARILEDRDAARQNEPTDADPNAAAAGLAALAPGLVTWKGWTTIDAHERAAGEPRGRPRVKVVRMARLREVAGSA